jgi:ABC-type branched-subunit amino acid transport system substrate-binding protein
MNRKNFLGLIVLVLVVILFVLIFNHQDTNSKKIIKIGASLSLTGTGAFIGESINAGLQAALKDINSAGGIGGKQVELLIEDNKNSGADGVNAFKALQAKNPDLVITSMSTPSVPVATLAKDTDIPLLATAVFADVLSKNENVVSFFPTSQNDVEATVEDMVKNKISNAAVVYLNSEYGIAALNAFIAEAKKNNITVSSSEAFLGDATDYATPVAKILSKKPQAVYVIAINAVPVINQIKNTKTGVIIYSNLIPLFGNLIYKSPQTFDGVHLTALKVSIPGTKEYIDFRNKVKDSVNLENNTLGYMAVAYDDLRLIAEILNKNSNPKEFVKEFSSYGSFTGVNGIFSVTGRNIGVKVYPVIFKDGVIQEVK